MTMEKLSEAILDKVKSEAEEIIKQAESTAEERLIKARGQQNAKYEEEKARITEESESEAARIQAQTSISVRQELLKAKNEVIQKIMSGLRNKLTGLPNNDEVTVSLIKEGIQVIGKNEVVVYIAPGHIESVKNLVRKDSSLSAVIRDYKETRCIGGAVIEDMEGRFSIDNTFDTRLETVLPRLLPEISKELFG
jgi:V/A-type H+-transporting ATPase subunit E